MKQYHLFALLSMFFAGLTAVLAKLGLKNVSGDTGLAVRTVFVFIFVWLNIFAFNPLKDFSKLTIKDVLFLAISALTTSLSWIFYYKAIKIGNVSEVALIDKASILITIILSILFLKEPISWKIATGCFLILGGLWILTSK
ncbi:MAG: EamA family transporter [Bacteroidia bacterium]|nr:EamA family transporter [Bacteroidia bacterium]MDW8159010.1 EamA family transporter [Bacteroidia bacterium]